MGGKKQKKNTRGLATTYTRVTVASRVSAIVRIGLLTILNYRCRINIEFFIIMIIKRRKAERELGGEGTRNTICIRFFSARSLT